MQDEVKAEQTQSPHKSDHRHHHHSGSHTESHTHHNHAVAESIKPEHTPDSGSGTYYRPSIERLRLILMFFMCINLFGFPTMFGNFIKTVCGFVPITFFVLSGFLVLRESEHRSERIKRSIKRCAITFSVMAIAYFLMNLWYYKVQGTSVLPVFGMKRFWFNFLIMNVWQFEIGSVIWYVQALLYAYIIIFFLDKFGLLKYDWIIFTVLLIITVLGGELSGIIKWDVAGYSYIPGNFFTRALPYVLLGGFMHRKMDTFNRVPRLIYRIGIPAGIILELAEIILLGFLGKQGYYGHIVGMAVTAVSIGMIVFDGQNKTGFESKLGLTRKYTNIIYYICQPVYFLLGAAIAKMFTSLGQPLNSDILSFLGIATFAVCFCFVWLLMIVAEKKADKTNNEFES